MAAFAAAAAACAADKRRLPTSAELDGFRQQSDVTLPNLEWTSDFTSAGSALTINDAGNFIDVALSSATPFRCVA
ncbi:MAG TPA: hypothetical protein VFX03_11845 [Thermomicrobiales bacterium]|nr:hypothetical protein [Thermomicrobiales bacterium]